MASARQIELARLVAAGVPGPAAMVRAGWPESTASWLGLAVDEYLRKAGLSGQAVEAVTEPGPMAPAAEPGPTAPLFIDNDAAPKPKGRRPASTMEDKG